VKGELRAGLGDVHEHITHGADAVHRPPAVVGFRDRLGEPEDLARGHVKAAQ
jgi:hypothetical protein